MGSWNAAAGAGAEFLGTGFLEGAGSESGRGNFKAGRDFHRLFCGV
jgi:hypothetical protein